MDQAFFVQLYDYNFWADRKFFECVLALTEEQYRQNHDFSAGPISAHAAHIMAVEYWWIHFLNTGELDFRHDGADQISRDDLRREWDRVEAQARAYVDRLTPDELARTVKPSFWGEDEAPVTVAQALFQVINHSMDHRTQALTLIHTRLDGPTFEQDFLNYLEETRAVR
jgi:uncharacterized damage-inducible protein DinB